MPGNYWRGEPIDRMTREELIAIIEELGEDAKREHEERMRQIAMLNPPPR